MRFGFLLVFSIFSFGVFGQNDDFRLTLGNQTFDPLEGLPDLPPEWQYRAHTSKDLFMVQFDGAIQADWVEQLKLQDLEVVQYIHPYSYIVWGNENRASQIDNVRWHGPFLPAWRVLPGWRDLGDEPVEITILTYSGADREAVIGALKNLGAADLEQAVLDRRFVAMTMKLSGSRFADAAAIPGVYTLQPNPTDGGNRSEMSSQVNVNNVDGSNIAFPGYMDWLNLVGLNGSNVTVAVVDSGTDQDHPDIFNNIVPCDGVTCGGSIRSNHGTHVAGIIGGDAASGTTGSQGFLRGMGVAPETNMVEQSYVGHFNQPNGMLLLMTDSYRNGAVLSSNSWGPAGSPRGYDNQTMQVDIGTRDVDSEVPGNQPFSYILAIMNGNGGNQSQGTPDEAKNIFKVGSTWLRQGGGAQSSNINSISDNSAHGPALDGRYLPDIVAPGKLVDAPLQGSGYGMLGGTSMACPQVAGGASLFYQYYRRLEGCRPDPSPALLKAAFIPVARDLFGGTDADGQPLGHRFDSRQGWGRMDLEAVVDPTMDVVYLDNPTIFTQTGQSWSRTFTVANSSLPVKMMLAWTDAPGHGLGGTTPAWNNDLDLVVTYDGQTWRGNNIGPTGWSIANGSADGENNTEGILLGPTASGTFTVEVRATNINSDAIPGQGPATDQDFALVCYNCTNEPHFTLCGTDVLEQTCSGGDATFLFSLDSVGGFSSAVNLSVSGLPTGASAQFDQNPITPSGVATMTVTTTGETPLGEYGLVIEAVSGDLSLTLPATLVINEFVGGQPTLTEPQDASTIASLAPDLSWDAISGAESYIVEVSESPLFDVIVVSGQPNGTTWQVAQQLAVGKRT